MIQLDVRHLEMVKEMLRPCPDDFYVYESRSKISARQFSDLDLCVKENLNLVEQGLILEAFEESDLPFTVDLLVWLQTSESFRQLIEPDLQLFPK